MCRLNSGIVMALVLASLAACGIGELELSGRRHQASQAIWAAEQEGAQENPRSARLLQLARREMMHAQASADDGDERNAALLFDRAEADSRLALQIARTSAERENARRAWESLGGESEL